MKKNYPIGINFDPVVLQWVKDEKKVDESQSQTVNRLLQVAMSCNSKESADDMARPVLLKTMRFFIEVRSKLSNSQVSSFRNKFNEFETDYLDQIFQELM